MARATSPVEPGTIERLAEWVLAVRAEHIADRTAVQAKLLLLDSPSALFLAVKTGRAQAFAIDKPIADFYEAENQDLVRLDTSGTPATSAWASSSETPAASIWPVAGARSMQRPRW